MIENLIQHLIDRLDQQFVGKYRGVVHDNADPEHRGRIRATVPRLLGSTTTGWALPSAPYAGPDQGFFAVPDKGAAVWIEFEEGDLSSPIWSGGFWGAPQEADVGQADSTARVAARPADPGGEPRTADLPVPETPQHGYPAQTPAPGVRILKSATGHHIVLDDRPDSERIEIHDSRGNRVIFSKEGMERYVSNERTVNTGARSAEVDGDDKLEVAGKQTERVGTHERTVARNATVEIKGNLDETVGGTAYRRTVDHQGTAITVGGQLTEKIGGGVSREVTGSVDDTVIGGYGLSTVGSIDLAAAGPVKIAAGLPDLSLTAVGIDAIAGNISVNTKLGLLQLGGLGAMSPLVLGDGLAIHLTMLAQILKAVNPMTVAAYGPALDAWAALTPALDLSYFGYVKRFPVG